MIHHPDRQDETFPFSVLERVCLEFEGAWKSGQTPRIEDYLGEAEGRERSRLLRELLHLELEYPSRRQTLLRPNLGC